MPCFSTYLFSSLRGYDIPPPPLPPAAPIRYFLLRFESLNLPPPLPLPATITPTPTPCLCCAPRPCLTGSRRAGVDTSAGARGACRGGSSVRPVRVGLPNQGEAGALDVLMSTCKCCFFLDFRHRRWCWCRRWCHVLLSHENTNLFQRFRMLDNFSYHVPSPSLSLDHTVRVATLGTTPNHLHPQYTLPMTHTNMHTHVLNHYFVTTPHPPLPPPSTPCR